MATRFPNKQAGGECAIFLEELVVAVPPGLLLADDLATRIAREEGVCFILARDLKFFYGYGGYTSSPLSVNHIHFRPFQWRR